jgi:hypothetical protein
MQQIYCPNCDKIVNFIESSMGDEDDGHYEVRCCECDSILDED